MPHKEDDLVVLMEDGEDLYFLLKPFPPFQVMRTVKIGKGLCDIYQTFKTRGEIKRIHKITTELLQYFHDQRRKRCKNLP